MKKSNCLILSLFLSLPMVFLAQSPPLVLPFNAFIKEVQTSHPLSKKAGNLTEIGKLQEKSARGLFDPQVNGGIEQKVFGGKEYFTTAVAEMKQPLYSGQSLKAGIEYGQGGNVNSEEVTPESGLPYLGVEFSLLQGLVIDKKRYEVKKSLIYKDLMQIEGTSLRNDLLLNASCQYANWLKDFTVAEVNQRFIETARQRFQALIALSRIGERPAVDTVESAILLQSREIDYGYARVNLSKSLFRLYNFRWNNDSAALPQELSPAISISDMEEKCLAAFLARSRPDIQQNPALQIYGAKSKLLQLEKKFKAEMIKPKLDLRYNLLGNSTSSTLYYANNYKFGAGFSMPLFLRNPVNDYRITGMHLKNNQLELQLKNQELQTKSSALIAVLNTIAIQVATAKRTLAYSKILLEAEKLKFENNESSLFLLNTRETKVLESEIKLIDLQEKFIEQYFYLVHLSGDLNYSIPN